MGVDEVLYGGRPDSDNGAPYRPTVHRYAPRDIRDASRTGRGCQQNPRLFPFHLEREHARRASIPVEREDALWEDFCRVSAGKETWRQEGTRSDIQACGRRRLAA